MYIVFETTPILLTKQHAFPILILQRIEKSIPDTFICQLPTKILTSTVEHKNKLTESHYNDIYFISNSNVPWIDGVRTKYNRVTDFKSVSTKEHYTLRSNFPYLNVLKISLKRLTMLKIRLGTLRQCRGFPELGLRKIYRHRHEYKNRKIINRQRTKSMQRKQKKLLKHKFRIYIHNCSVRITNWWCMEEGRAVESQNFFCILKSDLTFPPKFLIVWWCRDGQDHDSASNLVT